MKFIVQSRWEPNQRVESWDEARSLILSRMIAEGADLRTQAQFLDTDGPPEPGGHRLFFGPGYRTFYAIHRTE